VRIRACGGYQIDKNLDHSLQVSSAAISLQSLTPVPAAHGRIAERKEEVVRLEWPAIVQAAVQDRKAKSGSGPTYIGGGFGIEGAVKGMAMATAFQGLSSALTGMHSSLTKRGTIVGFQTNRGFFIADHIGSDSWAVRGAISDLQAEAASLSQSKRKPETDANWIDELERLAKLHAIGALSDTEFEHAKAKLLAG